MRAEEDLGWSERRQLHRCVLPTPRPLLWHSFTAPHVQQRYCQLCICAYDIHVLSRFQLLMNMYSFSLFWFTFSLYFLPSKCLHLFHFRTELLRVQSVSRRCVGLHEIPHRLLLREQVPVFSRHTSRGCARTPHRPLHAQPRAR